METIKLKEGKNYIYFNPKANLYKGFERYLQGEKVMVTGGAQRINGKNVIPIKYKNANLNVPGRYLYETLPYKYECQLFNYMLLR